MNLLDIDSIYKSYSNYSALSNVSFSMPKGSIHGLLGPNGAGKTTLIRIITNIIAQDKGEVRINGKRSHNFNMKHLIGYMPEERGLYRKMKVGEQLVYLARLRGMNARTARERIMYWLERLDASTWWNKTIDELSKGMSQKVQFIATIINDPQLIILDEPFSGLDPINSELIKKEIFHLKDTGATILFSTHRMEQIEEICNDIILMNKGKVLLNGNVTSIKNSNKKNLFQLNYTGNNPLGVCNEIEIVSHNERTVLFKLLTTNINEVFEWVIASGNQISSFKEILPTINEIFIEQIAQQTV